VSAPSVPLGLGSAFTAAVGRPLDAAAARRMPVRARLPRLSGARGTRRDFRPAFLRLDPWLAVVLFPRNVLIAVLSIYRALISPLYGDVCKFYPTCSRYALEAIQQHGVVRGVWLGSRRLARCHPWSSGGVDEVPACEHGRPRVGRLGFVSALDAVPARALAGGFASAASAAAHHTHRED